jgi:quercetin 2,3-dioxygenase
MISVRRAKERQHERRGKREVWRTFKTAERSESIPDGFGALELLDEHSLPPGASIPRFLSSNAEIITYVHDGGLACEDSTGRSGVIQAGEFQRMNLTRGFRQSKSNASRADWTHAFQLRLRRSEALSEGRYEQRRFSRAERRDRLCAIASPDARRGSLRTESVLLYSALLSPGQHVVHELPAERSVWLHVVLGDVTLDGLVLTQGDGAGIHAERTVSLTAREETEILLCELVDAV